MFEGTQSYVLKWSRSFISSFKNKYILILLCKEISYWQEAPLYNIITFPSEVEGEETAEKGGGGFCERESNFNSHFFFYFFQYSLLSMQFIFTFLLEWYSFYK